jgi:hypothetical protein
MRLSYESLTGRLVSLEITSISPVKDKWGRFMYHHIYLKGRKQSVRVDDANVYRGWNLIGIEPEIH